MIDQLHMFVATVRRCCDAILSDPALDADQRDLLRLFIARARAKKSSPVADPAAMPFLVARAEGRAGGESLELLAAGCTFYYLALRLFDDVADQELSAPWDPARPAIADNAALTLYTLALDAIAEATPADRSDRVRRALLQQSLRAAAAQHRDLSGAIAGDAAGVLAHNADKASVFALNVELAAIHAGCGPERAAAYRRVGEATGTMRQTANDLHDLFGKPRSGDLERGRNTLPLAVFAARATAAQREELVRLRLMLPESLPAIRRLLIVSPAVQACAGVMEAARQQVHRELDALVGRGGPLDLHRDLVDALAAELYHPAARAA